MQAALELDWDVVLAIGENNSTDALQPLPTRCKVLKDIPQIVVMPTVSFIISMAGTATTMEAMYHGLPMLVITPGYAEAEMYAENVRRHGLGLHVEGKNVTVDLLKRHMVRITTDDGLNTNVRRMQSIVRRGPGGEEVVNWIEGFIRSNFRASECFPSPPSAHALD
jgi:UDP:flavonoid glycosyltransferase YjiC (YdhE family)